MKEKEKCAALNIFLRALRAAFTSWQCAAEGILVYSLFQRENNGKFPASADVKGFMLFFPAVAMEQNQTL